MKSVLFGFILVAVATRVVLSVSSLACQGTSSSKIITITSPATIPTECGYTIKPTNSKICQLRFDLEEFVLAQPTQIGGAGHPTCRYDIFAVNGQRFCGINNNQHFYVTNTNGGQVYISLLLANRVQNPLLSVPKWKITITQLECPTGILGRSLTGEEDGTVETEAIDKIAELTREQRATTPDGYYLAPIGCLQYFPEKTGIVESFNLGANIGPYYSDFNYAICFARSANSTKVRLTAEYYKMGIANDGDGFDVNCYADVPTTGRQEDYLFLPFATTGEGRRGTRFCGNSLATGYVDIAPPGPFVISVVSDEIYNSVTDIGFKFKYEIL